MVDPILFLYDAEDVPATPLNYHLAALASGFVVIVGGWQNIKVDNGKIELKTSRKINKKEIFVKNGRSIYKSLIVIHRTWGCSDHLLESLRVSGAVKTSFHPLWPTICDKWEVELCFRNTDKQGVRIPRPLTFLASPSSQDSDLVNSGTSHVMIFKPSDGARSEGIYISNPENFKVIFEEVRQKKASYICQVVQMNPFLYQGRRIDCRIYVLILPSNPLVVYIMKNGIIRKAIASHKPSNQIDELSIITGKSFKDRLGVVSDDMTVTELLQLLPCDVNEMNSFWDETQTLIENVFTSVFSRNCIHLDNHKQNSFMLAGVDLLLSIEDGKLKPVFLEINNVPGLGHWAPAINNALQSSLPFIFDKIRNLFN